MIVPSPDQEASHTHITTTTTTTDSLQACHHAGVRSSTPLDGQRTPDHLSMHI